MIEEREPTPTEIVAFYRAAKALARLGKAGLHIYLAADTLCLLTGPSHEGEGRNLQPAPRQDRIRATEHIPLSGGGDW